MQRYLAFDIETAKNIPGDVSNWRKHRPLGIACAATLTSDTNQLRLWHSKTKDDKPAKRMSQEDARGLVDYLSEMVADGYRILTWNGLSFDFDILAEESAAAEFCKGCVLDHVDMMFHVVCALGYPVSLEKAAQGMGLQGKTQGMTGALAPKLWAQGQHQKVLDYVSQDVRISLGIAQTGDLCRKFHWITQKGSRKSLGLSRGWLPVKEALKLPEPDTSWMSSPMSRRSFTAWIHT